MPAHYTKTYDFDEEGRHIILRQPQTWEDAMESACDDLADTPAQYRNITATAKSYEVNRRTLAKRFQRFLQDYPEFEDPITPYMTTPVYIHDEETYKIVSLGRITVSSIRWRCFSLRAPAKAMLTILMSLDLFRIQTGSSLANGSHLIRSLTSLSRSQTLSESLSQNLSHNRPSRLPQCLRRPSASV